MVSSELLHFGLRAPPFTKEIDAADLWLPSSKVEIVDDVMAALETRGSVVLTGESGVGKTCVLRALRQRMSSSAFRLTYCCNATLGRRDFYRQLCLALGLSPSASAAALFFAVTTHIEDLGKERVHPVFLLDEAHLLQQDVIDHLHILLNYEWDSRALLSLVLVGLPDLEDNLRLRRNRSLSSRIHTRVVVDAHGPDDTREYLQHRLKAAGAEREIFAVDALTALHEQAEGSLREIDRIAHAALRVSARKKRKLVSREDIEQVAVRRA